MNPYYYDLSNSQLIKYYNSLDLSNASQQHIEDVEKEMESRV